jgi:signal recognition particle receptor subunit beta
VLDAAPLVLKIVIAGGFGAGKTTLVGSVSEIDPLSTEEYLTEASNGTDDLSGVEDKHTTTVAMDFGRITFNVPQHMVLMLFGTPGQTRFRFMWDDLSHGAIGAVILADTRRLDDSFAAVAYFETRGIPFVVAVNQFDNALHRYTPDEVRHALALSAEVPVLLCDARETRSTVTVLITLIQYALTRARSSSTTPLGARI